MPVKPLPPNATVEDLVRQAEDLRKLHGERDIGAAQRIREFHPRFAGAADEAIFAATMSLSDAQWTIARERGFSGWARLKTHIEQPTRAGRLDLPHHERIDDIVFREAVGLLDAGDVAGLRALLAQHVGLAQQRVTFEGGNYFHTPSLLEFIAENPVRHGRLPGNVVDVAEVIIDAGVQQAALDETLMLVATGSVARESGAQLALIDLLCDHGAHMDSARMIALHGEVEAVKALLRRGVSLDLPVAAALGRTEDCRRLLPAAGSEDRHLALALAAQFGHAEVVSMLLDAVESPDRYNPLGGHSHTTPLHQAALDGHESVVRLLVERGARVDMKDLHWHGTPADWARHGGRTEVEAFLRARENEAATGQGLP